MAYLLRTPTGLNSAVSLSSSINLFSNVGDYLEIRCSIRNTNGQSIVGINNSFDDFIQMQTSRIRMRMAPANLDFSTNYTMPSPDAEFILRFERVSSSQIQGFLDGESIGVVTSTDSLNFNQLLRSQNDGVGRFEGDVYYIKGSFNGGVSDTFNYNKQTLNGSNDTVLPDTVGINDGTLVNFATDNNNQNWVQYKELPVPDKHYLALDGVDDFITLQKQVGGEFSNRLDIDQEWSLEWKWKRKGGSSLIHGIFDSNVNQDNIIYRASDGLLRVTLIAGDVSWTNVKTNTEYPNTFRILKKGGENLYELFVDEGLGTGFKSYGTKPPSSGVQIYTFDTVAKQGTSRYMDGDLYYVEYTTSNSGVPLRLEKQTLKTNNDLILDDTNGGNYGNLQGFSNDNSQWTRFDVIDPTQYYVVDGVPAPIVIPELYTPAKPTQFQTLVITEAVINQLSNNADFWNNVSEDGGNIRLCSAGDGTEQLPLDIVSFDKVAKTCVIWTRKPSYNGSGSLYLFFGKAGETQPPVTDPFGRNAVWADYEAVLHLNDAEWTDSTGNGYDGTGSVSVVSTDNPFGSTWAKFDQTNHITIPTGAALNDSFLTVQAIFHRDGGSVDDAGIISNRYSTQGGNFFQLSQREARTINSLHDGAGENVAIGGGIQNGQTKWLSVTTSASRVIG